MIGLQSIGAVLSDPDLRKQLTDLASRKIKADLKTLEAHAELSRRLADNRQGQRLAEGGALKQIVREHLEYYSTLVDLSYSFHERFLNVLRDLSERPEFAGTGDSLTLNLTAAPGSTVRAPFKVTNNRADTIAVTCRVSPFISEDGSQLIGSPVAFEPPGAEIAPGTEQLFEAIIAVGPDFRIGRTYLATLSAEGLDAMQIVTRLTIAEPRPMQSAEVDAPPATPAAQPAAAPKRAAAKAGGKQAVRRSGA
ncbi:COG1470 family protein [Sphingomonas hengshuiensis]|uniref:Uncharacterized protein n=1 Tax=Sphingomonas hengshuiensis TaxID=1609977 RepID=A0A7U4J6L4_9SPHN|nr:hypothetical protein [Sphingomonas hengshuiensis]AJP71194.1 hypothetical protein TS85_04255 [Sphingomonas hengshuiensis]